MEPGPRLQGYPVDIVQVHRRRDDHANELARRQGAGPRHRRWRLTWPF